MVPSGTLTQQKNIPAQAQDLTLMFCHTRVTYICDCPMAKTGSGE